MRLLSIQRARSIWMFQIADLFPRGMIPPIILFSFLIEKYKFSKYPPLNELPNSNKGIIFGGGEFTINGQEHPIYIQGLIIYTDGVLVDTLSSTNNSDIIIKHMLDSFSEMFGVSTSELTIREKLYVSELNVHTDRSLEVLNPKLKIISEYLNRYFGKDTNFQTGGIVFWPEQKGKIKPRSFIFERAAETPLSENRYFSAAPLPTDKHLELLDKLEEIL